MSTTIQFVIVGIAVAAAAAYLARALWKSWTAKAAKGCGMGCGKCSTMPSEPKSDGRFPLPQA